MRGVSALVYRREGDDWVIELRLRELRQLFHSLDPSTFHQEDLDPAAGAHIGDAAREVSHRQPTGLRVYLPVEVRTGG